MGKHAEAESKKKKANFVWGLVHVLGYHHWRSVIKKMTKHHKHNGQSHDRSDWSPIAEIITVADDYETKELLDERDRSSYLSTIPYPAHKKRSLASRIKAFIAEEDSKRTGNMRSKDEGLPHLQRSYSIHHLEPPDGAFGEICNRGNYPIIFSPKNVDRSNQDSLDVSQTKDETEYGSDERPDVLQIFKLDKELLLKNLQHAGVANFPRSGLGLKSKANLSKSRSFPLPGSRKVKPVKLENKHKEVWSIPKEDKLQTVSYFGMESSELAGDDDRKCESTVCGTTEKKEHSKHIHRRSSSLNESLDKYTRLFESMNVQKDAKLDACRSLRLANESGGLNVRRMHTLSSVDSYYSNLSFEAWHDDLSIDSSLALREIEEGETVGVSNNNIENASVNENIGAECSVEPVDDGSMCMEEDNAFSRLLTRAEAIEISGNLKDEVEMVEKIDSILEHVADQSDATSNEHSGPGFISSPDISSDESESHLEELQILEGLEEEIRYEGLNSLANHTTNGKQELKNDENSYKIMGSWDPQNDNSDLYYVRQVLDQSGITMDALEITWHSPDKLLGPEIFEQMETWWPHEQRELTGLPDFHGCWHHQMLFDLVNEVLVDLYDVSLPYYPKALSSSCHVRPFPKGNCVIKEVSASIGSLLNLEAEQQQSVDCIVSYDQAHDLRWMNLQLETECIALDIENMVFHELLDEVIFACVYRNHTIIQSPGVESLFWQRCNI